MNNDSIEFSIGGRQHGDVHMFLCDYVRKLVITYTNGKSYHVPDAMKLRISGSEKKGFNVTYEIEYDINCGDLIETVRTTFKTTKYEVARIEYRTPVMCDIKYTHVYDLMKIKSKGVK